MEIPEEMRQIVKRECQFRRLKPEVLEAIITVESEWRPKVARYERQFIYTTKIDAYAKLHKITENTESFFQKCSWGLGQIMGGTARWIGYTGWLPDLCDPATNIYWCAEFFKKECAKYLKLTDQIAVYNAGSVRRKEDGTYANQGYVDKVMALLQAR